MENYNNCKNSIFLPNPITQVADMPYALYLSLQGKYFVGYADDMKFQNGNIAWAGLVNPVNSRVNLHIYVWTVTNIGESPLIAQICFNAEPSGEPVKSELVTPSNTALKPLPIPRVNLLQANNSLNEPYDGDNVFKIKVIPEVTTASEEVGKFIFPPGGSFIISLSNLEESNQIGEGRVAFGWWEEKIQENK